MKFANIKYKRNVGNLMTIGDDIQILAIENLYKCMGVNYNEVIRINFNELDTYDGEVVVLPICLPLYGYRYSNIITCFSDKIIPVFLSLSLLSTYLSKEDVKYLNKWSPIGCRDEHTLKVLKSYNIAAYLNGCITCTFPQLREKNNVNYEKVFCVDVPDNIKKIIPNNILKKSVFLTHTFLFKDNNNGEELAVKQLKAYLTEAQMIITTRLHAALPCAAMGIPVIFLKDKFSFRFAGIDKLIKIYDADEYDRIDWNPKQIQFEDVKNMILENAAKRLLDTYNNFNNMAKISTFFEEREERKYWVEFIDNTIEYINKNWSKEEKNEYSIWCATQTAVTIYNYIKLNYPKAKLVAVIDKKKQMFLEMETKDISWFEDNKEIFTFVCSGSALYESNKLFNELGKSNYYQCCDDTVKAEY